MVGGAAAGTAIAWFLATGAAAAEPQADLLGDAAPVLVEAVTPLSGTLDVLATNLTESPRAALDQVGDQLANTTSVDLLPAAGLADVVEVTGLDTVTEVVQAVEAPAKIDDRRPATTGRQPARTPAADTTTGTTTTGMTTGTGADPEHGAVRTATERAYAAGLPDSGSPAPATPDTPTWPAPLSPSAPAPGHTGWTGTNLADHPTSAALPWLDRAPGAARGLTAPATEATVSGRAGDQPGIAPD
ncbi:hypothetical protein GCM10027436_18650 [Actinophytocola sediminis]